MIGESIWRNQPAYVQGEIFWAYGSYLRDNNYLCTSRSLQYTGFFRPVYRWAPYTAPPGACPLMRQPVYRLAVHKGVFIVSFLFAEHGYLFIAGLMLVGLFLIFLSLVINSHVAHNIRADMRHREKLLEYYRNTISQVGIVLIGIGVSLSVYYFQQSYQERSRRNAELESIISHMALQLARGAAETYSLSKFDKLLDRNGPWQHPDAGSSHSADMLAGPELVNKIARIKAVQDDVDARHLALLNISKIFENSFVVNELEPALWFNIVRDESNIAFAAAQLTADYRDLDQELGGASGEAAVADPAKAKAVKAQVLDVLYDMELLRQSGRRLLARTCLMLAEGSGFTQMKPVYMIEADQPTHKAWLDKVQPLLKQHAIGSQNCFDVLGYTPPNL